MPTLKQLPCPLNDHEIQIKGEQLASVMDLYKTAEREGKEAAAAMGTKLKGLRADADKLAAEIKNKKEDRPVQCREEPDYREGVMRLVRMDTSEPVETRPLTVEERQGSLGVVEGGRARKGAKGDDGPPSA